MRAFIFAVLALIASSGIAQHIVFDPGNWSTKHIAEQKDESLARANQMLVDTFFVEDLSTGELTAIPSPPVLVRLEFDPVSKMRLRRFDIRQETRIDSIHVENTQTGEMMLVLNEVVIDIPDGKYEEYHPDGTVRISGTLNGLDATGEPRKTGEWTELSAGKLRRVIRSETYP